MQTALTRAEHEKALIALIQLSALKRNVTHAERGRSRGKSNAFSVSFIYQEAHISQITVRSGTCEPLCPQAPPGILSSGRERRKRKDVGVPVGLHLPVKSAQPVYTGC